MRSLWFRFISIIILVFVAFTFAAPNRDQSIFGVTVPQWFPNIDLSLGLDLQGGSQLTYMIDLSKVDPERTDDVVSGVEEVIRRRIDGLGVSEPLIQTANVGAQKHLIVELPGIKDLEEAKAVIGKVVELEFREQNTEIAEEEQARVEEANATLREEVDTIFAEAIASGNLQEAATLSTNARYQAATDWIMSDEMDPVILEAILTVDDETVYPEIIDDVRTFTIVKRLNQQEEDVREVLASHILVAYEGAERADDVITRTQEEAEARAQEVIDRLNAGEDFSSLVTEYTDEQNSTGELTTPVRRGGAYVTEFTEGALALENVNDYSLTPVESPFGYHIILARDIQTSVVESYQYESIIFLKEIAQPFGWKNTELTGEHFKFASYGFNDLNQPVVNISFNDDGKDIFRDITQRNINKPLAIFLDDKPIIGDTVYAPTVNNAIADGQAVITGLSSLREASELSQNLNAGAIPAPIDFIGRKTVEATLGAEALTNGLKAGAIGIALLFIYMIIYYRWAGLLANLALLMYATIVLAVFKIWPVTLSLAGIAGVVFSIGIAVDANILIFERMKEEIHKGKTVYSAILEGFSRAWTSIRDSNVSSLLICLVLFMFGSGLIRGFALTLAIGILVSMFSAITISKNLLLIFVRLFQPRSTWLIGAKDRSKTNE